MCSVVQNVPLWFSMLRSHRSTADASAPVTHASGSGLDDGVDHAGSARGQPRRRSGVGSAVANIEIYDLHSQNMSRRWYEN